MVPPAGTAAVRRRRLDERQTTAMVQTMTQNTDTATDSRIARRTALTLAGGAMASLAGCFGGGGSGSSEGPPEEQSDQISSMNTVVTDPDSVYPEIHLEIEMTEAGWNRVSLLTEGGNSFSTADFTDNETITTLPLTGGTESDPAPSGEHTLIFERQGGDEHRVPFALTGSVEFVEALSYDESSELSSSSGEIGIVFKNVGNLHDAIDIESSEDLSHRDETVILPPDETGMARSYDVLLAADGGCEEDGLQQREFTVEFYWSNPITVSVPIEYTTDGAICSGEISGTAEAITTDQSADSE